MKDANYKFAKAVNVTLDSSNGINVKTDECCVIPYSNTNDKDIEIDKLQDLVFKDYNVIKHSSEIDPYCLKKIYVSKLADLPRYKIREVREKYGINIVRNPKIADTIVISKDEIKSIFRTGWGNYYYKVEDFRNFLNFISKLTNSSNIKSSLGSHGSVILSNLFSSAWISDSIKILEDLPDDIEYLHLSYYQAGSLNKISQTFGYSIKTLTYSLNGSLEDYKTFESFTGKKIITDSALQFILGSVALEFKDYLFIDNLLNNSDIGNVEIGLTMMANCNFEKSKPYLYLLLNDHFHKYYQLPYCKTVSFKSLTSYLDFNRYKNVSYDDILNSADELGILDDNLKDIIIKRFKEDSKSIFKKYSWIKINSITLEKPEEKS